MTATKRPNSRRNLDIAIDRVAKGKGNPLQIRLAMANVIVGQMLPEGVVKGGSALKIGYGDAGSRFTKDLDAARIGSVEAYAAELEENLVRGWNGFTGILVPGKKANPEGVPSEYVMQPYSVKLSYNTKSWLTVKLELGHNEIGDADEPEYRLASDIVDLFRELGFPDPRPIPLMPIYHQIAQKLHAVTSSGSERAHDLVDLQLIANNETLDYAKIARTCERLFAYRKMQEWPPTIVVGKNWQSLYDNQSEGLDVLEDVNDAVKWGNDLINILLHQ